MNASSKLCPTRGCWTRIRSTQQMCLACALDRDLVPDVVRYGRPPKQPQPQEARKS